VYFFNNIHLYSFAVSSLKSIRWRVHNFNIFGTFQDLLEIYSGTLLEFLERKIETSRNHVLNCLVCSQKGFICELCRNPKIIYPFDFGDNYRVRIMLRRCHTCICFLRLTNCTTKQICAVL
jgi:hypothetical protein